MATFNSLQWNAATEWDGAQSESQVAHDNTADRNASDLSMGWSLANLPGTPRAYWPHHVGSGNIQDVANNYDAVPESGVTYNTGGVGAGSSIDYNAGYHAYIKGLNYATAGAIPQLSFVCWVYHTTNTSNSSMVISFDRSECFRCTSADANDNTVFATTDSGNTTHDQTGSSVTNNAWHMIGFVYDGTDKHIYIDGGLDNTASNPHSGNGLSNGTTRYGYLSEGSEAGSEGGSINGGHNIEGRMCHAVLWDDYAVSGSQMTSLHDSFTTSSSLTTGRKVA